MINVDEVNAEMVRTMLGAMGSLTTLTNKLNLVCNMYNLFLPDTNIMDGKRVQDFIIHMIRLNTDNRVVTSVPDSSYDADIAEALDKIVPIPTTASPGLIVPLNERVLKLANHLLHKELGSLGGSHWFGAVEYSVHGRMIRDLSATHEFAFVGDSKRNYRYFEYREGYIPSYFQMLDFMKILLA